MPSVREQILCALLMAVGDALAGDRSLGGLAEWLEWEAPKTSGFAIDGAAALRGATVPVTIHYGSSDPLGCPTPYYMEYMGVPHDKDSDPRRRLHPAGRL